MSGDLPVVFLAFANAPDDHLAALKEESRYLFRALQPLASSGRLEIHREESSGFDELYEDLLTYDDRIVVFHYGGHADGSMLKLEDGRGDARGIARLLGQQSSLQLVFLNGCATKDQVRLLHDAGVPAVIATAVKINDTRATHFSGAFYDALVQGQSIRESFASAQNYIEGKFGSDGQTQAINRSPVYDFADEDDSAEPFVFEWTLYVRKDSEHDLDQWRLTEAREDWRVQLEDNQGPIRSVDGQPFLLDFRSRMRNFDIVRCDDCGAKVAGQQSGSEQCVVCGSKSLQQETLVAGMAQRLLPVEVTREEAETIARERLIARESQRLSISLVYLPYWIFQVHAQVSYNAERGALDNADTDSPQMDWSEASETFDLKFAGYGVSACASGVGAPPVIHCQQATLDRAEPLEPEALSMISVPLEKDVDMAFSNVAAYLDSESIAEGRERVGGLEQRKVTTGLSYKTLYVQSMLVPHWYVSATSAEGNACLAVNAQSGTTHSVSHPGNTELFSESESSMKQQLADEDRNSQRSSTFASVFAGIGIGIMVGLLLGLAAPSAKSVVSVFIGAVGVGLAALLGLNDKHFSVAKGLRIGSFGLAVAFSALSGIYVRDHGLLSPSLTERVAEVKALFKDIDDKDLIAIFAAMKQNEKVQDGGPKDGIAQLVSITSQGSYLFSGAVASREVCEKLEPMRQDTAEKLVLNNFRVHDEDKSTGWHNLADSAQKEKALSQGDDLRNFLILSRDAVCGIHSFDGKVRLSKDQCNKVGVPSQSQANLESIYASEPKTKKLLTLVQKQLSTGAEFSALRLLVPSLCNAHSEK